MTQPDPAFATDAATATYYDQRASEYDEWWLGEGQFAARSRPGWHSEVADIEALLLELEPARTLDIACGSGFLTRHLSGFVVGVDQSPKMVAITQRRLSHGIAMVGDALSLPFADHAFDRVMTAHFYGHLPPREQAIFLAEARRLGSELLVIDSAFRDGVEPQTWQERVLNDGSRHKVFKRFLAPQQLADEIDGKVVFAGQWFVAAVSHR